MRTRLMATLGVFALVIAGCQTSTGSSGAPSGGSAGASGNPSAGTILIGVDLPLSGGETPNGQPTLQGVQMAVDEYNAAGGASGYTIALDVRDDAVNGVHNPDQGGTNAQAMVAQEDVVAMIGPFNSNVARVQIPITAPAGLLQCSPANTASDLTKPEFGADELRGDNEPSYVRVATTDDVQGPALAEYLYDTLGIQSVFIIDDTETYGRGLALAFEGKFEELGGTVTGHEGVPNPDGSADYTSILTQAQSGDPEAVFYGGTTTTGAPRVRTTMADVGMGDLVFMGGDGVQDGPGTAEGTFLNLTGEDGANSFSSVAAIHDIPDPEAFGNAYQEAYGEPPGAYSASGYSCAQVILQALDTVAAEATDLVALREAIRAYVVDPQHSFETALGPLSFDENGDTSQHIISFYQTDLTVGEAGEWVFDTQQDFGE